MNLDLMLPLAHADEPPVYSQINMLSLAASLWAIFTSARLTLGVELQ